MDSVRGRTPSETRVTDLTVSRTVFYKTAEYEQNEMKRKLNYPLELNRMRQESEW